MTNRRSFLAGSAAAAGLVLAGSMPAFAQWRPTRPITLVVPFGAGGGTDIIARAFASSAANILGVPVNVVNRPGAAGTTGAAEVARARPDGTTIMITSSGSYVLSGLMRGLDVNAFDSFRTVGQIGNLTTSLMVSADGPYQTIDDLVDALRANPGGLSWAHTGRGSFHHVAGQAFLDSLGLDAVDVPFSSGGTTRTAVIGGQVDFGMIGIQQRSGFEEQIRALALVSDERDPFADDVPTFPELGFDTPLVSSPIALFLPLGTPDEIVSALEETARAVTQDPAFEEVMTNGTNPVVWRTGAQTRSALEALRDVAAPIVEGLTEEG